jgi:cellulose synthase/poly-beta-1,6-N-acetylglucosamine synthase-like glycosyltransferase
MTTIQIAETNLDSTIIAHSSSLLAFRKSAAEAVSADSMAEDTEEFVLIRKKGFRTIVDPNVVCEEEVPQGFGMRRMQKARRAQGIVNVLLGNRPDVFNRKYGKFGSIVVPIEIFILVISPFTLISIIGLSIAVLYQIYPLVSLAVFAIIVAAALSKSTVIWSIMDAQLNSLIGTVKSISKKDMPLWEKVR